ncbi:MAG: HAMP domain-containing histidine kinase [Clostridia bacterium]|nr:HAMP domain-containing histidine kinase [Clostridia bacterium]
MRPLFKRKKNKKKVSFNLSLTIVLSLIVFGVLLVSLGLSSVLTFILIEAGVMDSDIINNSSYTVLFMVIGSTALGALSSLFGSNLILRPIRRIIRSMDELSSGNFNVRMDTSDTRIKAFKALSLKFNTLAEELQNTEMLRSDFVNNFSHEFKTPIVSIAGLAKLMKKKNLTDDEREQYLNAIEEESIRLSYMATSVLNMTKIENQSILTDQTKYNISEQIRSCILLLDNKWEKKNINFDLSFGEHTVVANEELMKQVFINLLDNAIKFSNEGKSITVSILDNNKGLSVSVTNEGEPISKENQKKIFNKFYQADESHSSEGCGIGLAIVKKIIDLHNGEIIIHCENNTVTFTVEIPKKQ